VADPGDVLENPASGQNLVFHKTTEELLEVEAVYTKATPSRPPVHYYPRQEERFEVLSGSVMVRVDGEERRLGAGDTLTVPSETPHAMWAEEAWARMRWQIRPALETEAFFETMWGLAKSAKTTESGAPNPLRAAVVIRAHSEEFRLAGPPWPVQKVVIGMLASVGKLLGYRARCPYAGRRECDP
jgi:quercetin dioxygenase-like cupin family protein